LSTDTTTSKKEFAKADYSIFESACQALNILPTPLCLELGYSGPVWSSWKEKNEMPKVAAIACEGLRRRAGNVQGEKVLLIKTVTQDQRNMLRTVAKGLSLQVIEL
jgi:hypothetical protein